MSRLSLVVVGNGGQEHVGSHFLHAAGELGLPAQLLDVRQAEGGSRVVRKLNWMLRDKQPVHLRTFGADAVKLCRESGAKVLLSTGIAPLAADSLKELGTLGVTRVNFLTDDPWNPAHRTKWFMEALACYDWVFSPRRANIDELREFGCRNVAHMPFGYASHLHYRVQLTAADREKLACDVVFVGGADRDRTPIMQALSRAGFSLGLYGGYWDRYAETKGFARGMADADLTRRAMASGSIAICLVRRANRDGHSMRTFEAPAMGACLLMEWTPEHEEIFGADGVAVMYFRTHEEMVEKARGLVKNPAERTRLAAESTRLITQGNHTYEDRLAAILERAGVPAHAAAAGQRN